MNKSKQRVPNFIKIDNELSKIIHADVFALSSPCGIDCRSIAPTVVIKGEKDHTKKVVR